MNSAEIEKFKEEFKRLVYTRGLITEQNQRISKCTLLDKDGSHRNAILRAIEEKKKLVERFTEQCGGRSYIEWTNQSKLISRLLQRRKVVKDNLQRIETKIEELEW